MPTRNLWTKPPLLLLATIPLLAQQPADIDAGWQLYRAHCAVCHGPDGAALATADLSKGQFRRGSADEDLFRTISNGIPGTAMPPMTFSRAQLIHLVAFVRFLSQPKPAATAAGGDRRRGRDIFQGKGGCPACHAVHGQGSRLGPDLSGIGAMRSAAQLETSLLRPDESVLPQHRFVRAVTRDGSTISGRRLNEDTHSLQLLDSQERLVSLSKDRLKEYTISRTSPMPSVEGKLTRQEIADLLSYLTSLKGGVAP